MLTTDELVDRLSEARRYITQVARISTTSWPRLYEEYTKGILSGPERLVLIHPVWYEETETDGVHPPIRGPRSFGFAIGSQRCQSDELWGYRCPFGATTAHADHRFPYAFGGPTEPDNAAWLCRDHNAAKGSDFHLLPLDHATDPWFERILARVAARVLGV